jgi:hypothetical protein
MVDVGFGGHGGRHHLASGARHVDEHRPPHTGDRFDHGAAGCRLDVGGGDCAARAAALDLFEIDTEGARARTHRRRRGLVISPRPGPARGRTNGDGFGG